MLTQGIAYINDNAPESDANNEQYGWILLKEDSDGPIAGWPESKVRIMAQNKSRALSGTVLQPDFMRLSFGDILLEASHGKDLASSRLSSVRLLRCRGSWMARCRKDPSSHCNDLGNAPVPHSSASKTRCQAWAGGAPRAWITSGSKLAVFTKASSFSVSDLKSFLTVEDDQTTSGRYNDAKLATNTMRAYALNGLDQDDELADDGRTSITREEFLRLTRRIFAGDQHADALACLKRTVVFLFGHHAVYLRLPSQDPAAKVHRAKVDNVHQDLLAEKDKPLYSKYKLGIAEYGPGWADDVAKEVSMISEGMTKFASGRPEAYIAAANAEIEDQMYRHLVLVRLRDKQGGSASEDGAALPPPPAVVRNPEKRCNRLGRFVYLPQKRFKSKGPEEKKKHLPWMWTRLLAQPPPR